MCRHQPGDSYTRARETKAKATPGIQWVVCPGVFALAAQRGMYDALMDWALDKPAFDGPCYVKQTNDLWILSPDPGCEL